MGRSQWPVNKDPKGIIIALMKANNVQKKDWCYDLFCETYLWKTHDKLWREREGERDKLHYDSSNYII